jgi:hypothetical protein
MSTPKSSEDSEQIKSHSEILDLIDEIKSFETDFVEFELYVPEPKEEIVEVKKDITSEIESQIAEEKFSYEIRRAKKKVEKKPIPSATFKIRFNEKGELVNVDLKKPKPKETKEKKKFSVKSLIPRKKGKGETDTETPEEQTSKGSKLKGGLGKLGKLKNIIPSKSKKSDKTEEETEEE